jgi:hypothetical protein
LIKGSDKGRLAFAEAQSRATAILFDEFDAGQLEAIRQQLKRRYVLTFFERLSGHFTQQEFLPAKTI